MDNRFRGSELAALQELAELFREHHASIKTMIRETKNHQFMTLLFMMLAFFGLVLFIFPFVECGLHQFFAGSECTCAEDSGEAGSMRRFKSRESKDGWIEIQTRI
jgi:hypothetical protein